MMQSYTNQSAQISIITWLIILKVFIWEKWLFPKWFSQIDPLPYLHNIQYILGIWHCFFPRLNHSWLREQRGWVMSDLVTRGWLKLRMGKKISQMPGVCLLREFWRFNLTDTLQQQSLISHTNNYISKEQCQCSFIFQALATCGFTVIIWG